MSLIRTGCLVAVTLVSALHHANGAFLSNSDIRVRIAETTGPVVVRPQGEWRMQDSSGKSLGVLPEQQDTTITVTNGTSIRLRSDNTSATISIGSTTRSLTTHLGQITISKSATGNVAVAKLPLEEYLRGVVPSEIGAEAPHEAKCAQAVAARSFAVLAVQHPNHKNEGYDICNEVHCQVYSGLSKATPKTDQAVRDTSGLVITFQGKPISAYYSSMCGGHTEDIRNVWPSRSEQSAYYGTARFDGPATSSPKLTEGKNFRQWLVSEPQVYCNPKAFQVLGWAGRNFRWTRDFSAEEVSKFVAKKKDIGHVREIRGGRRGASGRFREVTFIGEKGEFTMSPEIEIRRLFSPALRSGAFTIETSGTAARPTHFLFKGTGSGHAVGMCQTGAMGMANAGKTFREILAHYYSTAKVEKAY